MMLAWQAKGLFVHHGRGCKGRHCSICPYVLCMPVCAMVRPSEGGLLRPLLLSIGNTYAWYIGQVLAHILLVARIRTHMCALTTVGRRHL